MIRTDSYALAGLLRKAVRAIYHLETWNSYLALKSIAGGLKFSINIASIVSSLKFSKKYLGDVFGKVIINYYRT